MVRKKRELWTGITPNQEVSCVLYRHGVSHYVYIVKLQGGGGVDCFFDLVHMAFRRSMVSVTEVVAGYGVGR